MTLTYNGPATSADLGALAREGTVEAINLLKRVISDSRYPIEIRIDAAGKVLNLGWGKAVERSSVELVAQPRAVLLDRMAANLIELMAARPSDTIDLPPTTVQTDAPSVHVLGETDVP